MRRATSIALTVIITTCVVPLAHCVDELTFLKVIDEKTPQAALAVENEDARIDARHIKDERVKQDPSRSFFNQDASFRLG